MPIQITELNIAVSVNTPPPAANAGPAASSPAPSDETKSMVDECVDQVVKIIRDKKER